MSSTSPIVDIPPYVAPLPILPSFIAEVNLANSKSALLNSIYVAEPTFMACPTLLTARQWLLAVTVSIGLRKTSLPVSWLINRNSRAPNPLATALFGEPAR